MIKIRNPNTGNFFQYKKTSPSEVNEKLNHLHSNTWWKNCTLKKRINYLKSFQKQLMKTKYQLK